MVAMACATVFEVSHGAEETLDVFYGSWWFVTLLVLLGINAMAALVVRFPLTWRRAGFAVTHVSILVILFGGWVTKELSLDGQVGLSQGESSEFFSVDADTVILEQDGLLGECVEKR